MRVFLFSKFKAYFNGFDLGNLGILDKAYGNKRELPLHFYCLWLGHIITKLYATMRETPTQQKG